MLANLMAAQSHYEKTRSCFYTPPRQEASKALTGVPEGLVCLFSKLDVHFFRLLKEILRVGGNT